MSPFMWTAISVAGIVLVIECVSFVSKATRGEFSMYLVFQIFLSIALILSIAFSGATP